MQKVTLKVTKDASKLVLFSLPTSAYVLKLTQYTVNVDELLSQFKEDTGAWKTFQVNLYRIKHIIQDMQGLMLCLIFHSSGYYTF